MQAGGQPEAAGASMQRRDQIASLGGALGCGRGDDADDPRQEAHAPPLDQHESDR